MVVVLGPLVRGANNISQRKRVILTSTRSVWWLLPSSLSLQFIRAMSSTTATATPAETVISPNQAPPDHVVNFACGHPDASLLPVQQVASATQQVLLGCSSAVGGDANDNQEVTVGRSWLQYGRENGNVLAREAVAEFLTELYDYNKGHHVQHCEIVHPDTLCLTSGVSHSIQLVVRALQRLHSQDSKGQASTADAITTTPRPPARPPLCFVEDPSYFLVPPILKQSGYDVESVPTHPNDGLDLEVLEQRFQAVREDEDDIMSQHRRLLVLYCIPTHHNPLGISLSNQNRYKLVDLCELYDVYLIADEVYHGLSFPSSCINDKNKKNDSHHGVTAMALIRPTSKYVVSVSAFTKILCPGIRCGWIQTSHQELLQRIGQEGVLDSGGCSSQLSSGIIRQLIVNGQLTTYLATLRKEYHRRCHHLCNLLQDVSNGTEYPFSFQFAMPKGGYFLWVHVVGTPFDMDDAAFQAFCLAHHDVDFKTGTSCSSSSSSFSTTTNNNDDNTRPFARCIRLCFAYYDIPTLTKGVERLCQAIQEYTNKI